jgi:hypothetical protein
MLDTEVMRLFNARLICSIILVVSLQQCIASTKNQTLIQQDPFLQSIRTAVKQNINIGKSEKCHKRPIDAREEFLDHRWDCIISNVIKDNDVTKPSPVLIYSPCMSTYNLGNTLGNYLNEIACAMASKISLVIGTEIWDYPDLPINKNPNTNTARKLKPKNENDFHFFRALPVLFSWYENNMNKTRKIRRRTATYSASNVIFAAKATADASAISRVTKHCPCHQYCWSDETAPMWNHIRHVLYTIKLLHKCFELLCSLLMPFGWVYVFYVGHIYKIMKPFFHVVILSKHHHHHHISAIKDIIKEALNQHMKANNAHNRTETILNTYDLISLSKVCSISICINMYCRLS